MQTTFVSRNHPIGEDVGMELGWNSRTVREELPDFLNGSGERQP